MFSTPEFGQLGGRDLSDCVVLSTNFQIRVFINWYHYCVYWNNVRITDHIMSMLVPSSVKSVVL